MKRRVFASLLLVALMLFGCGSNKTTLTPQSERESEQQESGDIQDEEEIDDVRDQYTYSDRNPDGSEHTENNERELFTEDMMKFYSDITFDFNYYSDIYNNDSEIGFFLEEDDFHKGLKFGILEQKRNLKGGFSYGERKQQDYTKEDREERYNSSKDFYSVGEYGENDFRAFRENEDYFFEIIMSGRGGNLAYRMEIIPKSHIDSDITRFIVCDADQFLNEEIYNNFMDSVKNYHGEFDAPTYDDILKGSM